MRDVHGSAAKEVSARVDPHCRKIKTGTRFHSLREYRCPADVTLFNLMIVSTQPGIPAAYHNFLHLTISRTRLPLIAFLHYLTLFFLAPALNISPLFRRGASNRRWVVAEISFVNPLGQYFISSDSLLQYGLWDLSLYVDWTSYLVHTSRWHISWCHGDKKETTRGSLDSLVLTNI